MAVWSPWSWWVYNKWYLLFRYFLRVAYQSGFESQKNAQKSETSHYWVPINMTSGPELNYEEEKNLTNYYSGGMDPTRFHVMDKILSVFGVKPESYYSDWSFMYLNKFSLQLILNNT